MEIILTYIKNNDVYFIIGLTVLLLLMLLFLIIYSAQVSKLSRKYRKFMRGSKDKNIEELLTVLMENVDNAVGKAEEIKLLYSDIDSRLVKCLQKVSLTRYKAFDDIGSAALSFSIALLDANNDGVLLTGIYGSDECNVYAKPIDKGVPKYDLSEEEKKVLQEGIRKK